jgi:pimeloyl-ACP methyl ester carboxylesterase
MLGGGTFGAAMFAPHARELSDQFDIIRVQTLNVQTARAGEPMPPNYTIAAESDALAHTLDAIGVVGPVDVVGASFGAVVVLHFAISHPGRVRTLTLFEPPAFWVLSDEDYDRDPALREMRELTSAMTPSVIPTDEQYFRFRCLLGACPSDIPNAADAARAEWDVGRSAMRGLAAILAHREDLARISRFRRPVLLLTGSDTVAFHRRIDEFLARQFPQIETSVLPGGHSAPRTAMTAFVERLRAFLALHD